MIGSFLEALPFFAIAIACHILLCRVTGKGRFILKGLVLGLLTGVAQVLYQYQRGTPDIVSLYIFMSLWLSYLICFINLLNSVTLKMLERIADSQTGRLHFNDLGSFFNEDDALKARIDAMTANNFISHVNEGLVLTMKGTVLASIITIIRSIFSIRDVG